MSRMIILLLSGLLPSDSSIDNHCRIEHNRGAASGAYKTGLAPMTVNFKAAIRTPHTPGCVSKTQGVTAIRRTTDLARLLSPYGIMTMFRPNQRMRNLMQDRVTNMRILCMSHVMPRERDTLVCIIALAGTATRMIEGDTPPLKAVFNHQHSRHIKRLLQRACRPWCRCIVVLSAVSGLHGLPASRQRHWPPESRQGQL